MKNTLQKTPYTSYSERAAMQKVPQNHNSENCLTERSLPKYCSGSATLKKQFNTKLITGRSILQKAACARRVE